MNASIKGLAAAVSAAFAAAGLALAVPAEGNAAECGPGTVYDAPSNTCVVAPAAPVEWNAPPPPPPLPPISICPPIPFVAVCFPVN